MARKLLNDSDFAPPPLCTPFCFAEKTLYDNCPSTCDGFCPPFCILPLLVAPPPPPPLLTIASHKSHRISLALTVSLAVLATAFLLFTCYTIYNFCSSRYRSRRRAPQNDVVGPDDFLDEEHGPIVDHPIWYIRTIGLQPSVISAITIVRYKRGEGLIEGTDCAVCLNEFEEDETLRLLPKCNHAFHIPCVDTWLRSHTNCPMCRAGIVNNAAAPLPSQEPVVHNSGRIENLPEIISGSDIDVRRDLENELPPEIRLRIEDDGVSRPEIGLKISEEIGGLDGVIPMRRSVSLDSLSAAMISAAIGGKSERNSDNQSVKLKESGVKNGGQGIGSMQSAGTSSMKRSVSCSAVENGAQAPQQEPGVSVDTRAGGFRPGPLQLVSE